VQTYIGIFVNGTINEFTCKSMWQKRPGEPRCNWKPYAVLKLKETAENISGSSWKISVCTPTNRFAPGLSVEWSIRNRPDKSILERSEAYIYIYNAFSPLSVSVVGAKPLSLFYKIEAWISAAQLYCSALWSLKGLPFSKCGGIPGIMYIDTH
jgi:hypothetical protein